MKNPLQWFGWRLARATVARLYLHVNSLSVESVSAVRVSLRELVSAAIVHKRERVQGVMRV